jgi:hypothetical protein
MESGVLIPGSPAQMICFSVPGRIPGMAASPSESQASSSFGGISEGDSREGMWEHPIINVRIRIEGKNKALFFIGFSIMIFYPLRSR